MDKSHIISQSDLQLNDAPEIVWIRVQDAAKLLWNENPKTHNIGELITSIGKYGWKSLPIFDNNLTNIAGTQGAISAGNGRIESLAEMEKLKNKKLPRGIAMTKDGEWALPLLVGVDAESANMARAFSIDDNNLTLSGGDFTAVDMSRMWDTKTYMALLQGLSAENEEPVSVDKDTIERLARVLGEQEESKDAEPQIDKAEELQKKWQVQTGDLYRIGEHKLLCGDSTKREDVEKIAIGEIIEISISDPPYGIELDTDYSKLPSTKQEGNQTYSPIINDDKLFDYKNVYHVETLESFWFGADYYAKSLPNGGSWIVWDKRVEDKFDSMIGSAFELLWSREKHKREIIRCNNTLFSGEQDARNKYHPTQKPIKVIDWIINKYSKMNNIIIDYFAGSGTTMVACQNLSRKCRAIEISPAYCAVILQRMTDAFPGIIIEKIE